MQNTTDVKNKLGLPLDDLRTGQDLMVVEDEDADQEDDAEFSELEPTLSFFQVFKINCLDAIPRTLSLTFSFQVFLIVLLLNLLSENVDESAAATVTGTFFSSFGLLFLSHLFCIASDLGYELGMLERLEESGVDPLAIIAQRERISSTAPYTFIMATVTIPPGFLLLFFSEWVATNIFRQSPAVAAYAQLSLRPLAFFFPALNFRMAFEMIMFGFNKTLPAMFYGLGALSLGGLLSGLLGFGPGVIPRFGPIGVAAGVLLETYLTAVLFGSYVGLSEVTRPFRFFHHMFRRMRTHLPHFKNLVKSGLSSAFTVSLDLGVDFSIGILSGVVGATEQAAMTSIMQVVYFVFIPTAAFSFTGMQMISTALGAGQFLVANSYAKYNLPTTLLCLGLFPVVFFISPELLMRISGVALPEVAAKIGILTRIMMPGVLGNIVRYHQLQELRGMGDHRIPNVIVFAGTSVVLVLSSTLGLKTELGVYGVATGFSIGNVGAALTLFGRKLRLMSPQKMNERAIAASNSRHTMFPAPPPTEESLLLEPAKDVALQPAKEKVF